MIYTPEMNDGRTIFVFGSNMQGRHGAGAALTAAKDWGAKAGIGYGLTGHAFAIPTRGWPLGRDTDLTVGHIGEFVAGFLAFARDRPDLRFLVTRIACGYGGKTEAQIAPLFYAAPDNCVLPPGWRNHCDPNSRPAID